MLGENGVAAEDEGFVGVVPQDRGVDGAVARMGFGRVASKEELGAAAMSGM